MPQNVAGIGPACPGTVAVAERRCVFTLCREVPAALPGTLPATPAFSDALFVQESLQLLLRGMQHGHSFKAELATHQSAFQRSPDATILSEETWRRASLDFFKLVGLGLRDCCSLCGPHPKVSYMTYSCKTEEDTRIFCLLCLCCLSFCDR